MTLTLDRIKRILHADGLYPLDGKITLATNFAEDCGGDGLDLLEVVMEMEKEFGRDFDEHALPDLPALTVGDLVRFAERP